MSSKFQIKGGGETGDLFRSIDWSRHPLGNPDAWPAVLKINLRNMFASQHPMFIFWGPQHYCFYNDAYLPSIRIGKHPQAMGQTGAECWPEIWPVIGPQIDYVMNEGGSTWFENQLLPIYRNGNLETVYWTYGYSPIFSEDGAIEGTLVIVSETTKQVVSENNLVDTLESMSDGFFSVDKNWTITRVNKQHENFTQKTREEQIGNSLIDLFFSDPAYKDSKYLSCYRKAMNERVYVEFTDYYEPIDLWTDVRVFPKSDGGLAIFFVNSTARRKLEAENFRIRETKEESLRQERNRLLEALDNIPGPVAMLTGADHRFTYTNRKYREMIAQGRNIDGQTVIQAFPEAIEQGFVKLLDSVYKDGERFTGTETEFFIVNDQGMTTTFYLNFVYEPFKNSNGEIEGVLAAIFDVTEQVLSRKSVEASEKRYREAQEVFQFALESAKMGTWHIDLATNVVTASEGAASIWGVNKIDDDVFSFIGKYMHPDDQAATNEAWTEAVKNHTPYYKEYRIIRPDGETVWGFSKGETKFDQNGNAVAITGVLGDITDRVEARLKIEETQKNLKISLEREMVAREMADAAKAEAEQANHLKSAFLANMSHEIRTPLGAMLGFSDLLRDPGISASERGNYVDILARNGESLSVIINDILDLSKVEAGHLTLEYSDTFPEEIGADIVSLMRVKAKDKDLAFDYTHEDSSPTSIVSDPIRVRQILLNLVGNAIKFTRFGSVKVRSFGCHTHDGTKALCFEVTDTGIGIPDEQRENIFKMFVQADNTMTRRFGGTGLGLALSKSLAVSMGGDVELKQSEDGKGSTFLLTIPDHPERRNTATARAPIRESEPLAERSSVIAGKKILVVDDSPDNQQLIWSYLTRHGAIVDSADNGLVGYRKALSGNFDLVLMDIQMPEMDGYTATYKLREQGYTKPIIALTAHAMSEVRAKCLNVGCTAQLTKPINFRELIETVAQYT